MASTFVLSGTTMSHPHRHHGHGHKHSRSRSPAPLGTLNRSFKMEVSAPASPPKHSEEHHDHDHDHDHSHHNHDHDHDHSHAHSPKASSVQLSEKATAPLSAVNGWKRSSTSGGRPLVTPTNASFGEHYKAPAVKSTVPAHDHSAERSRFTNMLLPYTARWPMLHTIMTEKDSRRIFYFMRCVQDELSLGRTFANEILP